MSTNAPLGPLQQLTVDLAHRPLRTKFVGSALQAVGMTLDGGIATLLDGLNQSRPLQCDVTNLPTLSADRGIPLYRTEPIASQRARLADWRRLRALKGSPEGILRWLQPYFLGTSGTAPLPTIRCVYQAADGLATSWHSIFADGRYAVQVVRPGNFDFDGGVDILAPNPLDSHQIVPRVAKPWARFWVVVDMTTIGLALSAVKPLWNSGLAHYNDGVSFWGGIDAPGGFYTSDHFADIVSAITDAKADHETPWGVIFNFDSSLLKPSAFSGAGNPDGTWGRLVDGLGNLTRPPGAVFVYDRGQL